MSAIWGLIQKEKAIENTVIETMRESMTNFRIDHYDQQLGKNVYFACGKQYFNEEMKKEVLPLSDEKNHIYFTADCVLYNRAELIEQLSPLFEGTMLDSYGDGRLAYLAYLSWGETFVEKLRGSFAFAIYLTNQKKLLLYADHFARRYLAYYQTADMLCFATVYQPILAILDKTKLHLNHKWIVSAYADCTADTIKLPNETVYDQIYHVGPGQYVILDLEKNHVERKTYWHPTGTKTKLTDDAYRQLFLDTFQKAVKGLLRTDNKVGILLSGGLDSSSVAALAALHLAQEGKKLYGYTAVPSKDYEFTNSRLLIEDERDYVFAQKEMHPNLEIQFVCAEKQNCFSHLKEYASYYRQPVKPVLNLPNINSILEKAAADGCRIVLSGQNGNATISYGSILTYVYQKLGQFHWKDAYQEMSFFCHRHRLTKKRFVKIFGRVFFEQKIKSYRLEEDCFLKKEDIKKYQVLNCVKHIANQRGTGQMDSPKQREGFGFMPLVYQHMGFYDTYNSLKYGILCEDPTMTKEMVELCLDLPIDCFVHQGKERRAIRDYMKGYVPELILENHSARGSQAADYAFKVNRDWSQIRQRVYNMLRNPSLLQYIDSTKLDSLLAEMEQTENQLDKNTVAKAALLTSLSAFLEVTGN